MSGLLALIALALFAGASWADATSYAEAEAGGFTIDTSNSIGAKVTAAVLPTDGSTWEDVARSVTATIEGGATISQEGATGDQVDGARYTLFDGSLEAERVTLPDNDVWTPASAATAVAMFEHAASTPTNNEGIVSHYNFNGDQRSWQLVWDTDGDHISVELSGDGTFQSGNTTDGNATLSNSTLYSGAFTWDGSETIVYVDGTAHTTNTTAPASLHNSTEELSIGAQAVADTNSIWFDGKIYFFYFFDSALSSSEISSLHSNPWQIFSAASSWTSGPTVSGTTNTSYTIDFTTDIDSTVHGVACHPAIADPTGAQVVAGDCGDDTAAVSTCTVNTTGGVADSCMLGGISWPVHDLHIIACPEPGIC